MKKFFWILLTLLLLLTLLSPAVFADGGEDKVYITDSDNEAMEYVGEATEEILENAPLLLTAPAPEEKVYGAGKFASSSEFIGNTDTSAYMDRMVSYYIAHNPDLEATLAKGQPVIFLFEGASDIGAIEKDGLRTGGVCLVVRENADKTGHEIVYYNKNSGTLPDYPLACDYDNGHEGYGTGVLPDGAYTLYTVNHREKYAAFRVKSFPPCRVISSTPRPACI